MYHVAAVPPIGDMPSHTAAFRGVGEFTCHQNLFTISQFSKSNGNHIKWFFFFGCVMCFNFAGYVKYATHGFDSQETEWHIKIQFDFCHFLEIIQSNEYPFFQKTVPMEGSP